ncbi:hypothetical protein WMY93_017471 [Mugilogobius chulae]|uniref:Mesothelin-like protein n=1 Tax=Mugilogobius chulae TaxID=88201 RepID=A0AAW0P0G2_9GOBI
MNVISPGDLGTFFEEVSPSIQMHQENFTQVVTSALLQTALDKANLSSPSVSDQDYELWLNTRLKPLLVNLPSDTVTLLFYTVSGRSCNTSQNMTSLLDTLRSTLSQTTQEEIKQNIYLLLQAGPTPIRCYQSGSFYVFLKSTFLNFGFPNVSMFMSLLPKERKAELLDTVSTTELSQFLSQPNVIGDADICNIYSDYKKTPEFLEKACFFSFFSNSHDYIIAKSTSSLGGEDVPDDVKSKTLPCVWHLALSSKSRSDAGLWFDLRLKKYLRFLNKNLISSTRVKIASCFGFQKWVSVMGSNFTYNSSEFAKEDVYKSMSSYLIPDSVPKCYNASDAELNSKSWFVENIGSFVPYVTVADLDTFIPLSQGQFYEDPDNLKLFNNLAISETIRGYYISLLFDYNPLFSVLMLPGSLLCSSNIPSSAFSSLNEANTWAAISALRESCNQTDNSEANAALVSNLNFESVSVETFQNLGTACGGLSPGQLSSVPAPVLASSLNILGSVGTWNQEQAMAVIQALRTSGFQLLNVGRDSVFVSNILRAPPVVQEVFVQKIISVDQSPAVVVQNVPDEMATEIPLSIDLYAAMFFESVSTTDFDTEELSSSVLQGFTCATVKKASKTKVKNLVRSCRRRTGRSKVELKETQLTCMYNHLQGSLTQDFTEYPSDMLLYFNTKDVEKANCRSYFTAIGAADFSVPSSVLNKPEQIFSEARSCLGINDGKLSKDHVTVLGNLTCTLSSSYIENSDPYILETLKSCKDFSASQVAAIETLLLSGKTSYGNVTSWNEETLQNLGPLPLYFTMNTWGHFNIFDLCLDIPVLKDNLNAICEKVDDNGFQTVILRKLNEAYPAGVSDENVQLLASCSRQATLDDISKWNITKIDTLTSLMNMDNGPWEAAKSNAIITKYLSTPGNALGTSELNAIDSNLCALNTTTLKTITPDSFRNTKALNVASCSLEQKRVLYEIANSSFSSYRDNPTAYFNLIKNYLGGAPLQDIQTLSTQNISMDINTFQSLDTNVIYNLSVSEVQNLLGSNVADLKTFENATVVETWINLQKQSDLDTLGLGLTTTRVDPTNPPQLTNPPSNITASTSPLSNATATTSPPSNITASTSPPSNITATTSPPSNITASTSPPSNITASTSPPSNATATTNPPSNITATTSPPSNITATTSPPSNITATTSPSSNITASTSPPSNITASTNLPSNITASTNPPSNATASTNPPSNITTSTNPPSNITASTNPPSNATASTNPPSNATATTNPPLNITASTNPPSNATASTNPPSNATATTNPPSNATASTNPPSNATATTNPPSNATATTNPPSNATATTNPPSNATATTNPPSNATASTNPPSNATASANPPSNATASTNPPSNATASTNPPSNITASTNPPSNATASTNPPSNSTSTSGKCAQSTDIF